MEKIILLGCGGHAKSVADALITQGNYEIFGFTGTEEDRSFEYGGFKCVGTDGELSALYEAGVKNAFVCVGFMGLSDIRVKLYERLKAIGFSIPCIADKSAAVAESAKIGEGVFIGKNSVVNADAAVGKMAIINSAAVVEHDCRVGDFSHIAVGAALCGNVNIGSLSFIGANSTVIQQKSIGSRCIIGASSVVLRDVGDNEKLVGIVK